MAPKAPAPPDNTWKPTDHPKQVLGIGVAAFTIMTLVGPAGLALSSLTGAAVSAGALAAAAGASSGGGGKGGGSIKAASTKSNKFDAASGGPGDQSRTWRAPGWQTADAWSLAVPIWLAPRSPLTARVLADGGYLRAIFSTAWLLGPLVGFGLGLAGAHQTGGVAIAPSVLLTGLLLVLAIFDATTGGAGVLGFLLGMAIWRSGELAPSAQFKSFLGLAALWFAIPLISAAARPFRRAVSPNSGYAWDRLADGVIATLIAGWAVQKTIGGMPGLSGLDLSIGHHADRLALIAMGAVVARIFVEELGAWRYPNRLLVVQGAGKLPQPGPIQRVLATGLRTGMFVFMASAFLGNCWQLWAGAALYLVPQILSIYEGKFPNSTRLHGLLPVGILKTLVMLIIGTYFARLVFSVLDTPESMLRNGFLLLSLPGLALSLLGLFGHDGPDPKWTWPRQFLGTAILGTTVALVLTGW